MRINLHYFWEVGKIVEKRYVGISSRFGVDKKFSKGIYILK